MRYSKFPTLIRVIFRKIWDFAHIPNPPSRKARDKLWIQLNSIEFYPAEGREIFKNHAPLGRILTFFKKPHGSDVNQRFLKNRKRGAWFLFESARFKHCDSNGQFFKKIEKSQKMAIFGHFLWHPRAKNDHEKTGASSRRSYPTKNVKNAKINPGIFTKQRPSNFSTEKLLRAPYRGALTSRSQRRSGGSSGRAETKK